MKCGLPLIVASLALVTAQFDHLVGICDHIPAIQPSEFVNRRALLARELASNGVDAFVTEPGAAMNYFSDISWGLSERPFLLVVTRTGTSFIIHPQFEIDRANERVNGTMSIFGWEEHEYAYNVTRNAIVQALPPNDGASYRILTDSQMRQFITFGLQQSFNEIAQSTVNMDTGIVIGLRTRKSPAEQDLLRCANFATKQILKTIEPMFRDGQSQREVYDLVIQAHLTAGFTSPWASVLFGENAAYPHGTDKDIRLEDGLMVLIDNGGSMKGYQSDITRTFLYGQMSPRQLEIFNLVREAQRAALDFIRPGIRTGEADAVARGVIERAGFGPYFSHRLGHGIGVELHEDPYLVKDNDVILEPGMAFSVEPGIYIIGELGVRWEDIVLVTEGGIEVLGESKYYAYD